MSNFKKPEFANFEQKNTQTSKHTKWGNWFLESFDTIKATSIFEKLSKKNKETTSVLEAPTLKTDTAIEKASLSLDVYEQPAFNVIAKSIISSLKVALYGPRVTSGSVAAINQLQQLTRIYSATITKQDDREVLNREALRAYLGIVFTSFIKGFKSGDYKYNSVTAYQGFIENFVRKLL